MADFEKRRLPRDPKAVDPAEQPSSPLPSTSSTPTPSPSGPVGPPGPDRPPWEQPFPRPQPVPYPRFEPPPPPPPPPAPRFERGDLERYFLAKIDNLNSRIEQLNHEKNVVSKMLLDVRRQNLRREVSRSNSVDRIMIESKILEFLKDRKDYANWKIIYKFVVVTMIGLNESTFRTHLHRLKNRGSITHSPKHKGWKIGEH